MYPDHLQNGSDFGHSLLIFSFGHHYELKKRVKFGLCGHFLESAWEKWPEIRHADVSWPISELIRFLVTNFDSILTGVFTIIILTMICRNDHDYWMMSPA